MINTNISPKKKLSFFQKLKKSFYAFELKNRMYLSRHKFLYALIGGAAVVLYWRGVWYSADYLFLKGAPIFGILFSPFGSIVLSIFILASVGLLVQEFIGADIIISGIKKQKLDIDKTEEELKMEAEREAREDILMQKIDERLNILEKKIDSINTELDTKTYKIDFEKDKNRDFSKIA